MSADPPSLPLPEAVDRLVRAVVIWAAGRPSVRAVILIGSYARGEARADSDVDLMLLVDDPLAWAASWEWAAAFGEIERCRSEAWGNVTSQRAWYTSGLEVEFGLASPEWVRTPLDPDSAEVLRRGFVVLHDPEHLFDPSLDLPRRA